MLDNEMPGAALEAPDTFLRLAAPLWPRLPLGYTGGARWVAFYLAMDKVTYNDGASSGTGDTGLFLAFKRHPVVAPRLVGAHLGSTDEEASEWLVVDRQDQVPYLAAQAAARWHLVAQWPRLHRKPLEYTQEGATRSPGNNLITDWSRRQGY